MHAVTAIIRFLLPSLEVDMRGLYVAILCLLLAVPAVTGASSSDADGVLGDRGVYGWVERVRLLDGSLRLRAKLDSGAKTASLDATDIERFERDGDMFVRFKVTDPETEETMTLEKPLVRNVRIVRHSGDHQRRAVVEVEICLGPHRKRIEVSLIDRSHFIYPMLLGRSALQEIAVIDPESTYLMDPSCEYGGNPG